jgi:proteasome accessory factor C
VSDTAAAQLRRILHLIPRLADGETHSMDEVARLAATDARTIARDLESLSFRFDDHGGFVEGVQIFLESDRLSLRSNHFRRPMRLTASELCALELGLAMLRAERPAEEHVAIDRARARLRSVVTKLPDGATHVYRHAAVSGTGSEHLTTLRRAFRAGHKVRLRYRKAGEESSSDRVTCPFAIVSANGSWYVIAHCQASEGVRIFRLDRIESAEEIEEEFTVPAGFSLSEMLESGRAWMGEPPATLRVRYSPRIARWIAEREGRELDADGSVTIEHPLADPEWAVRHVLQYGPEAEVLSPPSVREAIVRQLEAISTE